MDMFVILDGSKFGVNWIFLKLVLIDFVSVWIIIVFLILGIFLSSICFLVRMVVKLSMVIFCFLIIILLICLIVFFSKGCRFFWYVIFFFLVIYKIFYIVI